MRLTVTLPTAARAINFSATDKPASFGSKVGIAGALTFIVAVVSIPIGLS
jgi:hypothetical protein